MILESLASGCHGCDARRTCYWSETSERNVGGRRAFCHRDKLLLIDSGAMQGDRHRVVASMARLPAVVDDELAVVTTEHQIQLV